jgi:hypothetical protein
MSNFIKRGGAAVALAAVVVAIGGATAASAPISLDLAKAFATRSPWRFTATQGPETDDPVGLAGDKAPGAITVCLRKGAGSCDPSLKATLSPTASDDVFAAPRYLDAARIVHPRGPAGFPVLLVRLASLHSGDGDQIVLTQLLTYDPRADGFRRVYEHSTGRNNNQDVRLVEGGPLAGDVIDVEPTSNAPYAFWVTVSNYTPAGGYKQALRYRSATTYGDGNPLSVIDSEMPNIERHLGVWRSGMPLPTPAGDCPTPHLVRAELWCK